jgi:L-threonylcarbamoyladenylate synthase
VTIKPSFIKQYSPSLRDNAKRQLLRGKTVVFPTETVYGIGAHAFMEEGIKAIYSLKKRPPTNPLIVHLHSYEVLDAVAEVNDSNTNSRVNLLAAAYWPGPLTLILPRNKNLPDIVSAGLDTVAVRVPQHPIALDLLRFCGFPIAAPSANRSNSISPTTAHHVYAEFGEESPLIIEGGSCLHGVESTVLSLIESIPCVLRPGCVTKEMLQATLGEEVTSLSDRDQSKKKWGQEPSKGHSSHSSPGQELVHYAPRTPLRYFDSVPPDEYPSKVALITMSSEELKTLSISLDRFFAIRSLSTTHSLAEIAANLFSILREMDGLKADLLLITQCDRKNLGAAIMDRLDRATTR